MSFHLHYISNLLGLGVAKQTLEQYKNSYKYDGLRYYHVFLQSQLNSSDLEIFKSVIDVFTAKGRKQRKRY